MIEALVLSSLLFQATTGQLPAPRPSDVRSYEGEWVVEVIDHIKVMPVSRVTMTIRATTITGAGPCNTYRGNFTVSNEHVHIDQLLRTMKSCDAPRMSEEADFFAVLNAVTSYEVRSRDTLALIARDGKTITARRSNGELLQRD